MSEIDSLVFVIDVDFGCNFDCFGNVFELLIL